MQTLPTVRVYRGAEFLRINATDVAIWRAKGWLTAEERDAQAAQQAQAEPEPPAAEEPAEAPKRGRKARTNTAGQAAPEA